MTQVVEVLRGLGVHAEGFRDNWDSLSTIKFPCIAHLRKPDHYIVISAIESQNSYLCGQWQKAAGGIFIYLPC